MAIGIGCGIGALVDLHEQNVFSEFKAEATATVVGARHHTPGRGVCHDAYDPMVTFTDSAGRKVAATVTNQPICHKPSNGETLRIAYDVTDPTDARFPGKDRVTPGIYGTAGAVFFATGAFSLARTVRLRRAVERGERLPLSKAQQKRREQTFKRYLDS
jgi:hypothetical protein